MKSHLLFLAILSVSAFAADPDPAKSGNWMQTPFVQVQKDGSLLAGVDPIAAGEPVGHSAFRKFELHPQKDKPSWILSGVLASTNSGFNTQGAAVYAGYAGGVVVLIGMSNMNGEVLLRIGPSRGKDGADHLPEALYVAQYVTGHTPQAANTSATIPSAKPSNTRVSN